MQSLSDCSSRQRQRFEARFNIPTRKSLQLGLYSQLALLVLRFGAHSYILSVFAKLDGISSWSSRIFHVSESKDTERCFPCGFVIVLVVRTLLLWLRNADALGRPG